MKSSRDFHFSRLRRCFRHGGPALRLVGDTVTISAGLSRQETGTCQHNPWSSRFCSHYGIDLQGISWRGARAPWQANATPKDPTSWKGGLLTAEKSQSILYQTMHEKHFIFYSLASEGCSTIRTGYFGYGPGAIQALHI